MSNEKEPHKGDAVSWKSSQGTIEGHVEKKLTHDTKIKGHEVKASPDDPQFLVKSDETGAEAAHKASALHERRGGTKDARK